MIYITVNYTISIFPFKLFLFSYAFLGPLHYLTEINWLSENNYFVKSSKNWKVFYISLSLVITFIMLTQPFIDISENSILYILKDTSLLLIILVLFSTSLIMFKKSLYIIVLLFLASS